MIPKTIHYCWFGYNPKTKIAEKCIKSWKKYCPDYQIIEWNEDNFDIQRSPLYVRQAYEAKKWAFVTDYVRLQVVYENGGIYMDTDVELRKKPDLLLDYSAYFGFEDGKYINTGLGFGAEKGNTMLQKLMDDYSDIAFLKEDGTMDTTPCPKRNTRVFLKHGLMQNNSRQILDGNILILPSTVLCPFDYQMNKTGNIKEAISIHWFSASWFSKEQKKAIKKEKRAKRIEYIRMLGKDNYNKMKKIFGK